MRHDPIRSGKRKPVNLSIDTGIVEQARAHGINLSQVSEAALRTAVEAKAERQWIEGNREALESWDRWVGKNGLPLEKYRAW
jgi:antitoxin CcdA